MSDPEKTGLVIRIAINRVRPENTRPATVSESYRRSSGTGSSYWGSAQRLSPASSKKESSLRALSSAPRCSYQSARRRVDPIPPPDLALLTAAEREAVAVVREHLEVLGLSGIGRFAREMSSTGSDMVSS